MQNKNVRLAGPVYIPASAGNLLNPSALTGGVGSGVSGNAYAIVRQIMVTNTDSVAHNFTLYIGATAGSAGGTQFWADALNVPANSFVVYNGMLVLESADFLSGIADQASKLTFVANGELGIR